ncbi:MAG: STAS domain-containing protein [Odoribacter sp.]|nr:STAS domain-containing protein [Odoribacter sp.]
MITQVTAQHGVYVAAFRELKRFTLVSTENVRNELKPLLNKGNVRLIFDLGNITFIDSCGIGCIISLMKTAKSNQSEIKLCNIAPEVMEIIHLLRLEMILNIEKNVDSALQAFQK